MSNFKCLVMDQNFLLLSSLLESMKKHMSVASSIYKLITNFTFMVLGEFYECVADTFISQQWQYVDG